MTFYSSIILITELLMLAMTVHVITYSGFNKQQKGWYIATFISIMVCAGAEFAVHCGYYDPNFAIPLTIITVLQFSLSPILAMMFVGALGLKNQGRLAIIVFSISLLTEIICAPFGFIFSFGAEGYTRGAYFFIYTIFYIGSLLYLLVSLFFVGKNFRHRDAVTIIMILVVLVAGIIPMTTDKINVAYLAIAIASSLCYIYYNDLTQADTKAELISNQTKMQEMQEHIISGLASLIESRDMETGQHVARTSFYVKTLAEDARNDNVYSEILTDEYISSLTALAPLHDVGKIVVSDQILRKPGKLTKEEFEIMKRHTSEGGVVIRKILEGVTDEDYLNFASDIATYHHERWDGSGYPKGLKEDEIPLSARIMAIADVFDALVSERCYKQKMPFEEAINIIKEESGSHFDPQLVEVFLAHQEKYQDVELKIKKE